MSHGAEPLTTRPSGPPSALRGLVDRWAWWVGVVLLGVAFLPGRLLPHLWSKGTSFPGYWTVAREWLAGTPVVRLYDVAYLHDRLAEGGFPGDVMFGPPSLVLTAVPVAWLPYGEARIAWLLLVLWPALWLSLGWLLRPLGAPGLVLFALLAWGAPVEANLEVGQIYPLMLAAHCLGLYGWRSGQTLPGALGLAPMIALRGWYGLSQAVGWWVGGRPRGLVLTGLLAGALLLASVPLVGVEAWRYFLFVQLQDTHESEHAVVLAYQTWRSLSLHLTTLHPQFSPDPPLLWMGRGLWLGGVALVGALSLWAGRRCRPGEDGGLGFALWTTVALLLAPVAEDHHFVLVALPVAVLWGLGGWGTRVLVGLALLFLLPAWPFDQPGLMGGWRMLLGYPRLYGTGLLWIGTLALSRSAGSGRSPSPSP